MREIKLLPCPFCGNNDRRVSIRRMGNKGYKVICGKCGASGPYVAIKEWHSSKMVAQGQAINLWNTRKPMERIIERLEQSRDARYFLGGGKISKNYLKGSDCAFYEAIDVVKEEGGIE